MLDDLTGKTFGAWTVLKKDDSYHDGKHTKWLCKCVCGNERSVFRNALTSGRSSCCGCIRPNAKGVNKTHGLSKTRLYKEWASMKKRCTPNSRDRRAYYERGIKVCDEWKLNFMSFYDWAIQNGYNDNLSIDRIDNNLGYTPDNCRWVPITEQQSNKRNNILIPYNGNKYSLMQLCSLFNFPYKTAHARYVRIKISGRPVSVEQLFSPIHAEKISKRFRHQ